MSELGTWEQVLLGVIALLALLFFGPGVRRAFDQTRPGTFSEWMGALTPLAVVIIFVVLLIIMARG